MTALRFVRCSAAAVALALTAACAPIDVRSFTDGRSDFSRYHTFTWAHDPERSTGDPRLDNNPFFHDRLRQDVERGLAARGFEQVSNGTADLVLHYHVSMTQAIDVASIDRQYEPQPAPSVENMRHSSVYDAGSIVLDLVEAKTSTLVWRGWAEASFDGSVDDQRALEQRIDEVIARIVATVPRPL